jgi:hypothetical protein
VAAVLLSVPKSKLAGIENVQVPELVTVHVPVTVIWFAVPVITTLVTVPPPPGVVHAPSPRKNVEDEQVPDNGTSAEKKFAPLGV